MKFKPNYKIIFLLIFLGFIIGFIFTFFSLRYISTELPVQVFFHTLGLSVFLAFKLSPYVKLLICSEEIQSTFGCFGMNVVYGSMLFYALIFVLIYLIYFLKKIEIKEKSIFTLTYKKLIIFAVLFLIALIVFLNLIDFEMFLKFKDYFLYQNLKDVYVSKLYLDKIFSIVLILLFIFILEGLYLLSCLINHLIIKFFK